MFIPFSHIITPPLPGSLSKWNLQLVGSWTRLYATSVANVDRHQVSRGKNRVKLTITDVLEIMENHGKPWNIMENHGKIMEKSWKIMEHHRKPWKIIENHGKIMEHHWYYPPVSWKIMEHPTDDPEWKKARDLPLLNPVGYDFRGWAPSMHLLKDLDPECRVPNLRHRFWQLKHGKSTRYMLALPSKFSQENQGTSMIWTKYDQNCGVPTKYS